MELIFIAALMISAGLAYRISKGDYSRIVIGVISPLLFYGFLKSIDSSQSKIDVVDVNARKDINPNVQPPFPINNFCAQPEYQLLPNLKPKNEIHR